MSTPNATLVGVSATVDPQADEGGKVRLFHWTVWSGHRIVREGNTRTVIAAEKEIGRVTAQLATQAGTVSESNRARMALRYYRKTRPHLLVAVLDAMRDGSRAFDAREVERLESRWRSRDPMWVMRVSARGNPREKPGAELANKFRDLLLTAKAVKTTLEGEWDAAGIVAHVQRNFGLDLTNPPPRSNGSVPITRMKGGK